jgi:hypothetical protein
VWNYMTAGVEPLKTIARSYTQPPQQTYVAGAGYASYGGAASGYGGGNGYAGGYVYGNGSGNVQRYAYAAVTGPYTSTASAAGSTRVYSGTLMQDRDRPLPPRSGGFGHRPRSLDLVTPFSGAI